MRGSPPPSRRAARLTPASPPRPPLSGTAGGQQAEAGTEPGPDPAVTAEAAGTVAAIAQAADEAGKALAAGNLDVALAALETARDLAAQGRRAVKAAASGRRAPATRPGALRDLVEEHLRKFPDAAFTPHQVGKVLTRSAGAVANALDKLVSLGTAQMVTDKPRTYRLAPPPPPPPPRTRPATPAPARRLRPAPRNARPARTARPGRQPSRPGRAVCTCTCARPAVPPGVTPSRRAGRPPLPARYIRALTGIVPRQVHRRYTRGTRRATGGNRTSRNNRAFLPH